MCQEYVYVKNAWNHRPVMLVQYQEIKSCGCFGSCFGTVTIWSQQKTTWSGGMVGCFFSCLSLENPESQKTTRKNDKKELNSVQKTNSLAFVYLVQISVKGTLNNCWRKKKPFWDNHHTAIILVVTVPGNGSIPNPTRRNDWIYELNFGYALE